MLSLYFLKLSNYPVTPLGVLSSTIISVATDRNRLGYLGGSCMPVKASANAIDSCPMASSLNFFLQSHWQKNDVLRLVDWRRAIGTVPSVLNLARNHENLRIDRVPASEKRLGSISLDAGKCKPG